MNTNQQVTFADSKPHLLLLDALRGVTALIVIIYHVFEGFATSITDQRCNHGYLAVDFFFLLSGFVIGFAYDDRWKTGNLTIKGFFRRRLIRLHPMVIFGAVWGCITFLIQGGSHWDFEGTGNPYVVGTGWIMLALLINMFMIPCPVGQEVDVRGNGEMFPLNGPNWSLFFEYVGNILYALLLRKLPTKLLALITVATGIVLSVIVLQNGYLGVGWTLADWWSGLIRMLFPYCLGMLLARMYMKNPNQLPNSRFLSKNAFIISSILLFILLPMPFVGKEDQVWQNGIYVLLLVLVLFPAIIWIAAIGSQEIKPDGMMNKLATFLGNLSYPLYMVHYPVMYLFYYFIGFPNVYTEGRGFNEVWAETWPIALGVVALNILIAWLAFRFYDLPIRKILLRKLK